MRSPVTWWNDPWRPPRVLVAITVVYLVWSLLPVLIAVVFSFNAGRSRTIWQGFSFRWYWGDQTQSVWHDAALHTALLQTLKLGVIATLITVPLGVMFAIGIDRWRGRLPAGANMLMLISFVRPRGAARGRTAVRGDIAGAADQLGTVRTGDRAGDLPGRLPGGAGAGRLATIGPQYEEAAMDLGASPLGALRRVTLPMLMPAIFASTVLVFADVIDDFVLVRYLSSDASHRTGFGEDLQHRARPRPTPALNALATLLLLAALPPSSIGFLVYRRMTRGDDTATDRGIAAFAGEA